MNIRKSINKALAQKDKPDMWLVERMGVKQQRLSSIKNSKANPTMATVEAVAAALDMSVSEFIALGEE
jgi:transcriptional regulator with XRE-family HTH domain